MADHSAARFLLASDFRRHQPGRAGPLDELADAHRAAEEESLAEIAAEADQRVPVVVVLDPLGDAGRAGRPREIDDALADAGVHRIARAVLHKAPVELDLAERKLLQPGERRISRAEIVDRQGDVVDAKLHRGFGDRIELLHRLVLGHLDDEARAISDCADDARGRA